MPNIGVGLLPILRTLTCVDPLAKTSLRHYRQVTRSVLRWYVELEDGVIQTEEGPQFDVRVLDYRIDVDRVLKQFHPAEVKAILCIVRDGVTHAQALQVAGLKASRPDQWVENIEIRMGQAFERLRLDEFLTYLDYLR